MVTDEMIRTAIPHMLDDVEVEGLGVKHAGKVRANYQVADHRVLVTTDRVSAFDRILGHIPFKGQVLNQLSYWWFDRCADIVPSHVSLSRYRSSDPNVMIGRSAETLPVEVVVRGYITGVTSTALWTLYDSGVKRPYGLDLPSGLRKNDRLPHPVITPTTKATGGAHDERLTNQDVLDRKLVAPDLWAQISDVAVRLFERGTEAARKAGLILVDTKYEFGLIDGQLAIIDEMHTPDSSRYWVAESWDPASGNEPENYDKEFLRLWFKAQGYTGEGDVPDMPDSFRVLVARRYIDTYQRLTGLEFVPGAQPPRRRVEAYLRQLAQLLSQPEAAR